MIAIGLLAGAAGTMALDISTYGDILASARPPSELPANVVKALATSAKVSSLTGDDDDAKNRRSGAGAIMGYGVGLGAGVGYAALRPAFRDWLPWPIAGLLLGGATLVASEGSATALGVTDWSKWTPSEWAADIIPRSLYGLTVAYVVERLTAPARAASDEATVSGDAAPVPATTSGTIPPGFDEPVMPGRARTESSPVDPIAIEADREINPPVA